MEWLEVRLDVEDDKRLVFKYRINICIFTSKT